MIKKDMAIRFFILICLLTGIVGSSFGIPLKFMIPDPDLAYLQDFSLIPFIIDILCWILVSLALTMLIIKVNNKK